MVSKPIFNMLRLPDRSSFKIGTFPKKSGPLVMRSKIRDLMIY